LQKWQPLDSIIVLLEDIFLPACAVLNMDVVGSGPMNAVTLVTADARFTKPGTRSEVTPVTVH